MLDRLRRIIQEVNTARDLDQALEIIVTRVKATIVADVCSVYLADPERREHVLRATDGLAPDAVGRVRLAFGRGLVGLVAARAESLNLDDAPAHPAYEFVAETGEKAYHGFLGVPIIQHRTVLGVLVVRQREPRRFAPDEVDFVFTLGAQLAGAISHATALDTVAPRAAQGAGGLQPMLKGLPGSSGVAIGKGQVVFAAADLASVPDRQVDDRAAEETMFRTAVEAVRDQLRALSKRVEKDLPPSDRALFDALLMMIDGDSLVEQSVASIREGQWAPAALRDAVEDHARVFDGMDDNYLRERASDVRDLGRRILSHLLSIRAGSPGVQDQRSFADRTILVGEDLTALHLAEVPPGRLAGIVSAQGSSSSHAAILARAFGVPAVMGVEDLPVERLDGSTLVLDGYQGIVHIAPDRALLDEYERLAGEERELNASLEQLRGLPSQTIDEVRVHLFINTGLLAESDAPTRTEAEGVGLYRTEFPFMTRDHFPSEQAQSEIYRGVLADFAPRPVTIRTLDVGGDKPLAYFRIDDANPFLGWRGIRITLDHPEIFLTQLRAMLRASEGLDNLQILLPMVSTVSEVDESLALLNRAYDELRDEGLDVRRPRVGVMIEVPAAVYQAESIARRVDFLSIGTNDLTQYLLAVDRNNRAVADLYDSLHPAVLRAVYDTVRRGHCLDCTVAVCGEMAGDPVSAILLVGMGVDELSMSGGNLLRVKAVVRAIRQTQARALLDSVLALETGNDVRHVVRAALEEAGLGGLVRAGR
ncbi:MAG: phosphoenolpyruvate--protein phosphotransferase [Chromatiales bacterium]|nr:phosphoenolpyruvate--protein phosphotransferase [Chromatiales bacterium]